jgi:hypothetical protein
MKKILIAIAHKLSMDQLLELGSLYPDYCIETLEGVNPSLHKTLSLSCPDNVNELNKLALELCDILTDYAVVLLPIGSPAFNFALAINIHSNKNKIWSLEVLFSHSEKVSVEKVVDNKTVKTNEFKHKKFITFNQ